jgi:copper chaperone CopZ
MKGLFFRISGVLLLLVLVSLLLQPGLVTSVATLSLNFGYGTAEAQDRNGTSKVIFKVQCYDEGKAALQGMKGIQRIETGFHYISETDTVYYDPKLITTEEMENALRKAGTYIETIKKERN